MKVIAEYSVCEDCFFAIANDDYTSLDYYYTPEEAEERIQAIQRGLRDLGPHLYPGDKEHWFGRTPCECCGIPLHGCRYLVFS